ncbi:MAG: hypothetical protein F9K29_09135 [Hyphomicrobiaceae bacterium]|nr:MAG: hypothetical protein F9K29_09135 [Hyphomicrobiaceae bacterium]
MRYGRGALIAAAAVAAATTAMTFGATSSFADGMQKNTRPVEVSDGGPQFSVNATYTTDYRFRGFTQTREKSALQGGIDMTWRHFYVGVWATNVDFGREQDTLGRWHDAADVEVVTYAGIKHKLLGGEVDVRAIYYAYPGAFGVSNYVITPRVNDLDYFEVMLGFKREIMPSLTLESKVYYSPDYQGGTGRNWVLESGLSKKLGTFGEISPSFSAMLGSSYGEESKGGIDYHYWNAGFSFLFKDYFEFDIRYYDTFDVPSAAVGGSCRDRCDGRVVARITFEN